MTLVTSVAETLGNPANTFRQAAISSLSPRGIRKGNTVQAENDRGGNGDTREQRGEGKDRCWERSFPDGSVNGLKWVLDVLDDLVAYSDHRGELLLKIELERARTRASELICRSKAGNKPAA